MNKCNKCGTYLGTSGIVSCQCHNSMYPEIKMMPTSLEKSARLALIDEIEKWVERVDHLVIEPNSAISESFISKERILSYLKELRDK